MTKTPVLLVELYLPEDRLWLYRASASVPSGAVSLASSALSAPSFQLLLLFPRRHIVYLLNDPLECGFYNQINFQNITKELLLMPS